MNSPFLQKCLDMLQEKKVQDKILLFMQPFINCILDEVILDYNNLSILLVFVCFFLIVAIFYILIKK